MHPLSADGEIPYMGSEPVTDGGYAAQHFRIRIQPNREDQIPNPNATRGSNGAGLRIRGDTL